MRVGLHINQNTATDAAVHYADVVKPALTMMLDASPDAVARHLVVNPAGRIVHRRVLGDGEQTLDNFGDLARRVINDVRQFGVAPGQTPRVGVTFFNEHVPSSGPGADPRYVKKYVAAEVAAATAANAAGLFAIILNFSTGTMDSSLFEACREAFEYCHRVGPAWCRIGTHEYSPGNMGVFVITKDGLNQWPDGPDGQKHAGGWTGSSTDPTVWWDPKLDGWTTLRYRMLRRQLVAAGLTNVGISITESGVDNVTPNPAGGRGWRSHVGTEWDSVPGLGRWPDQVYWYGWQLSHDKDVEAVTFGFAGTGLSWDDFDDSQEPATLLLLMARQRELPIGVFGAPIPAPVPVPPVTPVPILPTPPVLRPRVTAAVGVYAQPAPGEGAASFAGRAAGHAEAPFTQRMAWAQQIAEANSLRAPAFSAGIVYRMPAAWFVPKEVQG